jgi:hypothetical protein
VNVKEGMRRLAVVFGVLGAGLGAFGSYSGLGDIIDQRSKYKEFESLAISNAAKEALPAFVVEPDDVQEQDRKVGPRTKYKKVREITTLVKKGGIKSITFSSDDLAIKAIETEDGRFLYKRDAPPVWIYLLQTSWPVLGFFVPWGTIRVITWVLLGFQERPK